MTSSKPSVIDRTVEKTHVWLHGIADKLGTEDERTAYHALRAVLHTLRDRLTVDDAAHLGAQLPMLVRGIYYEGWHPAGKPLRVRHGDAFADRIEEELRNEAELMLDPEQSAAAVFEQMQDELDQGEVQKLLSVLPKEIRTVLQAQSTPLGM